MAVQRAGTVSNDAWRRHTVRHDFDGRSRLPFDASFDLVDIGERTGQPLPRGITMLGALVRVVVLSAVGYGLALTHDGWRPWVNGVLRSAVAALPNAQSSKRPTSDDIATREPLAPVSADMTAPPPLLTAVVEPAAVSSPPDAEPVLDPADTDQADPAGSEEEAPERLPDPPVADPLQARALAAGLHPGLSRAILSRLDETDFANARTAVSRALAETPAEATFTWPAKPGGRAQFRVHFVTGATACRRYVVTVTLERWSTTALPLERCGG